MDTLTSTQPETAEERRRRLRRGEKKRYFARYPEKRRASKQRWRSRHPELERAQQKRKRRKESLDPVACLIRRARKRAREKRLPWGLRKRDIAIPEVCPVLGIPLFRSPVFASPNSPSLDRMKPELGYVPGNIAVISSRANTIKSMGTADEHQKIADWMRASGAV